MTDITADAGLTPQQAAEHIAHHQPTGWRRWLYATNHKDIGTLYLWFSFIMFMFGGLLAMLIRSELMYPGMQIFDPEFYNQLVTMHGLIMIFGAIMPGFVGLANWMIPLMIGAPDMALPRMNNLSFWILPFAAVILVGMVLISAFFPGHPHAPDFGWTMYAPLSTKYGPASTDFLIVAVHIMSVSSILGAINVVVTIFNLRAPGMSLMKMPMFVWGWLVTAFLLLGAIPFLSGAVTLLLFDRHFGTSFFDAAGGGNPVLYQHIFWVFGHPEVYIMILPAFGIMSETIPTFARKRLFGYTSMVFAMVAIGFLSYTVWAHHMFTVGMPLAGEIFFMYSTMLISVPTGVKVFNWIATMWRGSLTFELPMKWSIAFVILFTCGGLSGLMLAVVPADFQYQDTYFVVAHFHYVLVTGAAFGIMAAAYYWLPKWSGIMPSKLLGELHFWNSLISVNLLFFPMHFVGLAGMPRRYADYSLQFADYNFWISIGAFWFGLSQLIFLVLVIRCCMKKGKKAPAKPWEGAEGLEWTVPSPAPFHTFTTPPVVD